MKITELFDRNKIDKEFGLDKVSMKHVPNDTGRVDNELTFDLAEDLIYFMHNNDDFYRKNFFPVIRLCKKNFDQGNNFSHRVFKPVVEKAYGIYQKEFPLRELRDSLEEEMIEEVCKKIHEAEMLNMREGNYK